MPGKTNSSTIYTDLREAIENGEYAPACALTEEELARKYGVCRNTIKKSLMMLANDGLVTLERNKGAKVKSYSITEVLEFLEVREELESLIIRNAVMHISYSQIAELEKLLSKMITLKENRDLAGYSECNQQFHNMIYEICTNRTAVDLTKHLKSQMKKYNGKTIHMPGRDENSLSEHTNILEAIKNHDEKAAELYMRIHIRNVANTFKENKDMIF